MATAERAKAARQNFDLATERYKAGVDNHLVLLDAQRTQLAADDALADAEAAVNIAAVGVYKALGGAGTAGEGGLASLVR